MQRHRWTAVVLFLATGPGFAASDHADTTVFVPRATLTLGRPAGTTAAEARPPACERALAIDRVLRNATLYRNLLAGDTDVAQIYESTDAVLRKVRLSNDKLVTQTLRGTGAQCESMCVVLPEGARMTSVQLSDRVGYLGATILPAPPLSRNLPPTTVEASGSATDTITMGESKDYGYRGLQWTFAGRAVCVTAMNWNTVEANRQAMRVNFER